MEVVQRVQEHQGLGDLQQYLGCLRHTRSVALQKNIFLLLRKNICLLVEYEKYLGRRAVFSYEDNIYETQINNTSETGCGWLCCIKLRGPSYQFPPNYATQLRSVCRDCCCCGGVYYRGVARSIRQRRKLLAAFFRPSQYFRCCHSNINWGGCCSTAAADNCNSFYIFSGV